MAKRNLFEELKQGLQDIQDHQGGKITLKTHQIETPQPLEITPDEIISLRNRLNLSRAVFASFLRVNLRTLEKWEQGYSRPNEQATTLIKMVEQYPDTIERLSKLH